MFHFPKDSDSVMWETRVHGARERGRGGSAADACVRAASGAPIDASGAAHRP